MGQLDAASVQILDNYFTSALNFKKVQVDRCESAKAAKEFRANEGFARLHEKLLNSEMKKNVHDYFPSIYSPSPSVLWAHKLMSNKKPDKKPSNPLKKRSKTGLCPRNTTTTRVKINNEKRNLEDEYEINSNIYYWYFKTNSDNTSKPRFVNSSLCLVNAEKIWTDPKEKERRSKTQMKKVHFMTDANKTEQENKQATSSTSSRSLFYPIKQHKNSSLSSLKNGDKVQLTFKELKEMPIKNMFISDAKKMFFQIKTNSFVPKN